MFSKACEYAIKAVIIISLNSSKNKLTGVKEISEEIDSPEAFTAKILQNLVKQEIISSKKGPNGGFYLSEDQIKNVKISHIVKAIDGDSLFVRCGLGLKQCSEKNPCPIHHDFKKIREQIKSLLESTPINTLSIKLIEGLGTLKLSE